VTSRTPAAEPAWTPERRPRGAGDALALAAWTAAVGLFFLDALTGRGALFYFDVTEINLPYRDFLAHEIRSGRFARWHPGLYCGLPLYSESQAGYWHPLKYLLYPWMATWRAFNLDTVLSVWLAGLGGYGWLRRHAGPAGALAGAAVLGLGGFTWAHLIHTSMTNALISVPLVFWALEWSWASGRLRGAALGGLALACQVFAGHLQDALLTGSALVVYGCHRSAVERTRGARGFAIGSTLALLALGVAVSAVQWVPSKELLDRSPRAGGLSYDHQTYGSWHPELLPALLVREAYGTLARDTDWMDGYYPYHEMNAYLGVVGLGLAAVGAAAYRDRWVGFWPILAGLGGLLMLGKFTALFDGMRFLPIVGSSRIPVRYHLWVTVAVAALAAVGVDRLARPGRVRLRGAVGLLAALAIVSIPLLILVYRPLWTDPVPWSAPDQRDRTRRLAAEIGWAAARTLALALAAWWVAARAVRTADARRRRRLVAALPVLLIADLLGAHAFDVPTIPPAYWTVPPAVVGRIGADPGPRRVLGLRDKSAAEPGYASKPINFLPVRDTLAWSLPPVWGLPAALGETPIRDRRTFFYTDSEALDRRYLDVGSITHVLVGRGRALRDLGPPERVGAANLQRNPGALPRARLVGRPSYVADRRAAARAIRRVDPRERLVVEDPDRPLAAEAAPAGRATILRDEPERVEVETDSAAPAYLFLADTYDPGWSATVDGHPAPIRPAQVAFRAVYLPPGGHIVAFAYRPAGFRAGLAISVAGLLATLLALAWPRLVAATGPIHGDSGWPRRWPAIGLALGLALIGASTLAVGPGGKVRVHPRWSGSFHRFTWGAAIDTIKPPPPRED